MNQIRGKLLLSRKLRYNHLTRLYNTHGRLIKIKQWNDPKNKERKNQQLTKAIVETFCVRLQLMK